jgi:hypothetical protein
VRWATFEMMELTCSVRAVWRTALSGGLESGSAEADETSHVEGM